MKRNDDDDGGAVVGRHFDERADDTDTIEARHHQIDDHRIDVLAVQEFQGFDAIGGKQDIKVGKQEHIAAGATEFGVIVDNEDGASS